DLLVGARDGRGAVGVLDARRRPDAPEDVLEERGLGEGGLGVAAAGVPGPAAVVVVAPGDRVVRAHGEVTGLVARLVERREDVDLAAHVRLVAVPLVRPVPLEGQVRGGGMHAVGDVDGAVRGARGVAGEVGPDELSVPGPVVLGVARGVDAGVAAAALDVLLESSLLRVVQHVTRGGEPDDDVVVGEVLLGEVGGVLGVLNREAVVGAELLDRGDALLDGPVPEAGRLAEHQRAELAVVRWWFDVCAGTTDSEREDERAGEDGARGAGPPSGACWSVDHGNLLGVAFTCGRAGARLVRPDIVRPG